MRIALISYEYPPETGFGGIGTYAHAHARALARLGHEVHVFAGTPEPQRRVYKDGNVTVSRLRKVGVVERLLPRLDRLGLYWFKNRLQGASNAFAALRYALVEGDFDVVEMPECGGEGALINHCLDLPTVVRLHSPAELIMPTYVTGAMDRALTAMVERMGMSGARALTSCSHWLADEVRRRGLTQKAITVIPNGIDLTVFDQDEGIDIEARFGVPRDALKVFFANRLEPRKGIHVVRDLLAPVLKKHPETVFVLAGADSDDVVGKELQPLLAEHGLEGRLFHLGRITQAEIRACLKQSDIFLLASTWENAPYSLLEAMSAGKAIVASDCGGVPEMLRHDIDGLIAPTGDAPAFARAIDRLHTASTRVRLGQSARARVEARFTDDVVARRSLEFYRWALGAPLVGSPSAITLPGVTLGPSDWFQAWWVRGAESGEQPRAGAGFEQLGLDQLGFVHAVSARVFWAEHAAQDDAAIRYLRDLSDLHRARSVASLEDGGVALTAGELALPSLSHPLFRDDGSAENVLAELWRLGDAPAVADWLVRETTVPGFAERAQRRMALRRLAVESFRRRPSEHSAGVLRRIYRVVGVAPRVVQQDEQFITENPQGAAFGAVVAELGLHAPLRRPSVFGRKKGRGKAKRSASDAQVTVLIPSFRHEDYVVRAIESALEQSHPHVRVLVVDDRSPDGTVDAARGVSDPRVEVRVNDENLGLGGSILAALPTIETPYIALLNSDDVFHPERIRRCLEQLERDDTAALVASRIAVMDDQERRLRPDNSCVVDVGSAAHGWVRWYDGVVSAIGDPQWASVEALLAHNHLATSSNIVCRTEFLRAQAEAIAPLKYCLDWSLFLAAAIEGSLRVVQDELIGYRLHGANTVWFDEAARPGYVHEVNAVVAHALRQLVARKHAEGAEPAQVAELTADLLQQHVRRHGETGGLALLTADLTAALGAVPAAFSSPELVRMAEDVLQARRATPDPQLLEQRRRDRHALEALRRRLQQVEPRLLELEQELARREQDDDDGRAYGARIEELREDVDRARVSVDAARQELAACRKQAAERERALEAQLAANAAAAAAAAAASADEAAAAAAASADELRRVHQLREDALAELAQRNAAYETLEAAAAEEARRAAERARTAAAEGRSMAQREQQLRRDLARQDRLQQRVLERLAAEVAAHRHSRDAASDALEYRFGRLLLKKLKLGGLVKTGVRWASATRIGMARLLGRFRKQIPAQGAQRVLLLADDAFPAADSGRLTGELLALRDAGFDARVACWRKGSPHWMGAGTRDATRRRVVLRLDQALQRRDRRWAEARDAAAAADVDELARLLGVDAELAFTFARTARSMAVRCVHVVGLGRAAGVAWGAYRLGCAAYTVRFEACDLVALREPLRRRLAREASALFVDSEALADRVRAQFDGDGPDIVVVPPLVSTHRATGAGDGAFVCSAPFQSAEGLLVLADAVKLAADEGVDLRFCVLGAATGPAHSLVAVERFRAWLAELGIAWRFDFRDDRGQAQLEEQLARSPAFVDVSTGRDDDVGGASLATVVALAAGRPIVGFGEAVGSLVGRGRTGLSAPLGDAKQLSAALVTLHSDGGLRASLGEAARSDFDQFRTPLLARRELCARMRAVINARLG